MKKFKIIEVMNGEDMLEVVGIEEVMGDSLEEVEERVKIVNGCNDYLEVEVDDRNNKKFMIVDEYELVGVMNMNVFNFIKLSKDMNDLEYGIFYEWFYGG